MATATLTNTPTVISDAESVTNWGGDTFSLEPDIKVQGSNSVACTQTNNGANDVYYSGSWNFSTDVHLRLWMNSSIVGPYGKTKANDGVQIFLYDGSNTAYYTVSGSDEYTGGWIQLVLYTGTTPTSGSVNKSSITRIGIRINTSAKPRNVTNGWYDYWTYGDGYTVTGGSSSDPITWEDIANADTDITNTAYNIVSKKAGIYAVTGKITIGDGTNTTYFDDSDIVVFQDLPVSSSLYQLVFYDDASGVTNIDINGGVYACAGTQRFTLDASNTDLNSFTMKGKQVSRLDGATFVSGQTIQNCVFDDCLQVDPGTSTFDHNTFSNSTDTGGALLFPSDDSHIKDLQFINCDNGVEYDSNSDSTSPAFDNFQFDDVSGKYDVNNTSGSAVSISLNNGSNANSYTGSTVTFLGSSVTTKIIVSDLATGTKISGAIVLVEVTDGSNFPYQDSVSITGSGTTATVTHTSHGLSTGDHIIIRGANEDEYNGVYEITVSDSDTYTYTMNESASASPATGTITATFAFIAGTTDGNGEISDTRVISNNQPIKGRVRKASSSPYYKSFPFTGTVNNSTGFELNVSLVKDE